MRHKLLLCCTIAVSICLLFGFLASIATEAGLYGWYPELKKPWFEFPDWIFKSIWLSMYFLIGIAAGIIWDKGLYHKWVKVALYHFCFQLLLSTFWPILFFGLHRPFWAFLDILAIFILVLITIKWFKIISKTATLLMVIYAVWIFFTAAVNFEVWRLNYR